MRFTRILFAVLGISLGMSAEAASFDCALASSRIDNAICASPQVSALDSELDAAYRAALIRSADQEAVRVAQRSWLKTTRNKCQDDDACLVAVYRQRIAALNSSHPDLTAAVTSEAKAEAKANVEAEEAADRNLAMENAAAEASAQAQKAAAEAAAAAEQAEKLKVEAEKAAQALEQAMEAKRVAELEAAKQKQILQLGGGIAVLIVLLAIWIVRTLRRNRNTKASSGEDDEPMMRDASSLVLDSFVISAAELEPTPPKDRAEGVENYAANQYPATPTEASVTVASDLSNMFGRSVDSENIDQSDERPADSTEPVKEKMSLTLSERVRMVLLKSATFLHEEIGGLLKSIAQLWKNLINSEGLKSRHAKELVLSFISNLSTAQRIMLITILVSVAFSSWPNPGGNASISSASGKILSLQQGAEYKYYSNDRCTDSSSEICVSADSYRDLCKKAKGVTERAILARAMSANYAEAALLRAGALDKVKITWGKTYNGVEHCYAIVWVSGLVNGTSTQEEVQGIVKSFILNDRGELLVSYFDLI